MTKNNDQTDLEKLAARVDALEAENRELRAERIQSMVMSAMLDRLSDLDPDALRQRAADKLAAATDKHTRGLIDAYRSLLTGEHFFWVSVVEPRQIPGIHAAPQLRAWPGMTRLVATDHPSDVLALQRFEKFMGIRTPTGPTESKYTDGRAGIAIPANDADVADILGELGKVVNGDHDPDSLIPIMERIGRARIDASLPQVRQEAVVVN
ncbi:MAG TPA: hypothetical protein VHC22_24500 [Pirellulales bacterium]|nr:hypothetical protein [Pirellulales bacterium]